MERTHLIDMDSCHNARNDDRPDNR